MAHVKDWMRYRFGCPRAPIQLYAIDRCSWARELLVERVIPSLAAQWGCRQLIPKENVFRRCQS
jgi:hypothetical protein